MCIKKICFNQEVKNSAFSFICRIVFEKYFMKAIDDFFPCLHSLIKNLGGVGIILDSYANLDCVSGLHNCPGF